VVPHRATPIALPDGALVDGRMYDLVVWCAGNTETNVDGLEYRAFDEYAVEGGAAVAARHVDTPVFRVGPHARLPFTYSERQDGIADLPGNAGPCSAPAANPLPWPRRCPRCAATHTTAAEGSSRTRARRCTGAYAGAAVLAPARAEVT